jgi:polyisoprenoid-binding protein YceI
MKKVTMIAAGLVLSANVFAQTWNVDKVHSHMGFDVTHLGVSNFTGTFKTFDAKLTAKSADFSDAAFEMSADVASISTENSQRDEHLKSADFFDASANPAITFKSKSFKKVKGKMYKVTGDLTMHGVTKPVVFDAMLNGTTIHPMNKKNVAGFTFMATIKRSDFGIGASMPEAMLSDAVKLVSSAEFVKE